jgi:hypothetical protein
MILFIVAIASSAFGQHILACKGTDQVSIGSSAVFQMEEGKIYPIIGFSASGNLVFATPFGPANYSGDRLRVTDGGQESQMAGNMEAPTLRFELSRQLVRNGPGC